MFAGAAREAVFSNPEVIRRVNAEFVPVALKAAFVNNPGGDIEQLLYREIGRSKPAPQGICVVNSDGKVLDWVLMFDNDRAVLGFLDHARERFQQHPDISQPFPAERYMKFPSAKLEDVADSGRAPLILERHPPGQRCPAQQLLPQGTIIARVFGRALGPDGKPMVETVRQEHYIEDRFEIPVNLHEEMARALAKAGSDRFEVPDALAWSLVSHAYLGQLDVNPCGSPAGGESDLKQYKLWAQRVDSGRNAPLRIRVEGHSEVAGGQESALPGQGNDGRTWRHEVKLQWEGFLEMRGSRIVSVLLWAAGSEKLNWRNDLPHATTNAVSFLPAGHYIDQSGEVRYGIIGEPVNSKR